MSYRPTGADSVKRIRDMKRYAAEIGLSWKTYFRRPLERYIVTARADYADREDHHFPVLAQCKSEAVDFAIDRCDRNGWNLLGVASESGAHNVPALEPLRWGRQQKSLQDLNRRMKATLS